MNVFATSPAHAPARAARKRIEFIASSLRDNPAPFDRQAVADRLARAIRALYAVLDTSVEAPAHSDGLTECVRVLGEAKGLLLPFGITVLDDVIAMVARAGDEVVDVMLARRGDPRSVHSARLVPERPFQASIALPRLHALARSPISPPLDMSANVPIDAPKAKKLPPAKPKTLAELRAAKNAPPEPEAPPPVEAPAPAPAPLVVDDGEVLRRIARDCLEDVAGLRMLRHPVPTETWADQAPFEQRLLDNVDAFVALGQAALRAVTLFHADAPAPDPSRGFAVALTLGCIEGTDTTDVAIATMRQAPPEEMPGFAEGFILAPSPAIDVELAALLDAPNPALAGVALDVLGARGSLPPDAPERILPRGDAALDAKLALALGRALPKTKALTVLANLADDGKHDAILPLVWTSLLRRGDNDVRTRLRAARTPAALRLLALSGRGDDVALLTDALREPGPELVRAVARHGHVDALPALIALLDSKDEELVPVVAAALDFMTNAGLRKVELVPWSPESTAMREVVTPIADRAAWTQWYTQMKPRLDPRLKMRHGVPFTPGMIAAELEAAVPAGLRDEAALELVIASGAGIRFRTDDWVAKQKTQLAELRSLVASLGSLAGAWWYAGAGVTSK